MSFWTWITGEDYRRHQAELAEQVRQHQELMNDVMNRWIKEGRQLRLLCGPCSVRLRVDERVCCVLPGTTFCEPRSVRVYQGGSTGMSFRVAKGVRLRVGGSRGQYESHDELRAIDTGDFIITDRRVIFAGSGRTATIELEKIVATAYFADGLRVNKEGRDKPYVFIINPALTGKIDGVVFNADGDLVNTILDQAKELPPHRGIMGNLNHW
jgi:hypothetical protein